VGGDFNADDFLDLLITSFAPEGHVLYGGPTGLVPSTTHLLGTAVGPSTDFAAGNFGAKGCVGCDDLAVSRWPGEVVVIYGSTTGLAGPTEVWTTANGIPGVDLDLPATLAAHNFGKGSHSDLAIRVKSELPAGAGAVAVMYGDSTGLSATGAQLWHQWSTGIQGTPEPHDQFGSILGK
jgi:hypothetical protein